MSDQVYSPWARPTGIIERRARYEAQYGLKSIGLHRHLADQLIGGVICDCPACGGTGVSSTIAGNQRKLCSKCHGLGSTYTISLQELDKLRQQVLTQYPDAAIPGWQPFRLTRIPALHIESGVIVDLKTEQEKLQRRQINEGAPDGKAMLHASGENHSCPAPQSDSAAGKDRDMLSRFMQALNSGKKFDELDSDLKAWWLNRY